MVSVSDVLAIHHTYARQEKILEMLQNACMHVRTLTCQLKSCFVQAGVLQNMIFVYAAFSTEAELAERNHPQQPPLKHG